MADPNDTGAPRPARAWRLGPDGWSLIEDPAPGVAGAEHRPEALKAAGYVPYPSIHLEAGRWASDYQVTVYDAHEPDRFLVCLRTRAGLYKAAVEGFPQLLDLLGRLIPIARLGAETQDKEHELKRRAEPTEGLP